MIAPVIKNKGLTEHNLVRALAMHVLLFERAIEYLDVSTTAVNVLLMLDGELNNEGIILIAKWSELFTESIKPRVLRRLDTWGETDGLYVEEAELRVVTGNLLVFLIIPYLYHFLVRSRIFHDLERIFQILFQGVQNKSNSSPMNLKY